MRSLILLLVASLTCQTLSCPTVEANTDYFGNDIETTQRNAPGDCCGDCQSNPTCVGYVWFNGYCYLKNKQGVKTTAAGAHAGIVRPKCSLMEENVDYYGNDIGSTSRGSAEECCADCSANPACVVSVWYDGTCWLKNKVGGRSHLPGARAVFPKSGNNPGPISPTPSSTLLFINQCSFPIELHRIDKLVCSIAPGGTCDQHLAMGEHPMFRHTNREESTLVEFTMMPDKLWFDVSVVPPNCGNGQSHDECLRRNGGRRGFNVPVKLLPFKYNNNPSKGNCRSVTCPHDVCPEAYVYPFDDLKMRDCPSDESIVVTYCP